MKRITQILAAILILTSFISCTKDEDTINLEKKTISAKWNVSGTSDYKSFEFNESGNYIVTKNATTKSTDEQIILFGTYTITNNTKIVLSDFGTLKITEINDNSIKFSIQLTSNPNNEIITIATKQDEIGSTTKTEMLCRSWKLVLINGKSVTGWNAFFSKAGTFVMTQPDGPTGLGQWKWKDESESKILYSFNKVPIWEDALHLEIIELTNSTFKCYDVASFGYDHYVFEPIVNEK